MVDKNPHLHTGYPNTGFNRCPLARLINHRASESDSDNKSNQNTDFQFEEKKTNKNVTQCFVEMQKASNKYQLVHKEENLQFKWRSTKGIVNSFIKKKDHVSIENTENA